MRPKGIAVDHDNRIWVVDAGVSMGASVWSTEVAKIYDQQGRLLLFFGRPGNEPGNMNLPTKIILDYEHVNLFRRYAVKGADIKFLVLVSNQYGLKKVNVYGFGEFPVPSRPAEVGAPGSSRPESMSAAAPPMEDAERMRRTQEVADLYSRSMELYRAARLEEARAGFVEVIKSGLIPPAMEQTLKGYIEDIDGRLADRRGVRP